MDTTSRYIVPCDITWYGIWYHNRSRYIMRYHTGSPQHNRQTNPQPRCGLLFAWLSVSALFLACLSSVPPSLSSFCCPSAGHIIGLTTPPANKNSNATLSPQGSACSLGACMFVFVSFICVFSPYFFSFPVFFCLLATLRSYVRGT